MLHHKAKVDNQKLQLKMQLEVGNEPFCHCRNTKGAATIDTNYHPLLLVKSRRQTDIQTESNAYEPNLHRWAQ